MSPLTDAFWRKELRKAFALSFSMIGVLVVAHAAIDHHHNNSQKAKAAEARKALYQAKIQQCLDEGRYQWRPTYEPEDYLQVYPKGSVSPGMQCAWDAALQLQEMR